MPPERPKLGGLQSASRQAIPDIGEHRLLRALDDLATKLRDVIEPEKAVRLGLREAADMLRADHRCLALLDPGRPHARIAFTGVGEPGPTSWPCEELSAFARGGKADLPEGMAVARLRRRRRAWGAVALRWTSAVPTWDTRHALTRLFGVVNDQVDRIESRRLQEVRSRIDRKIIAQVRPKDLLYQLLDGLRSLTGYDLSGAVLLRIERTHTLDLVAEQLAFQKGRSARIGARAVIPESLRADVLRGQSRGFSRDGEGWLGWSAEALPELALWLQTDLPRVSAEAPDPQELIIAPLVASDDLAGLITISAQHHGTFGIYECELLDAFLPQAMIALHNARRAESLEDRVIQSERKHAMAELARGVAHDVNNALGAVLPLVQQLRTEAEEGRIDPAALRQDLEQVERSLRACVRIFGNMLQFARRSAHETPVAEARLEAAVEASQAILSEGLRRHGIRVDVHIDPRTPTLCLRQSELDQVLVNLMSNAKDAIAALGRGGTIEIHATVLDHGTPDARVRIDVRDTGIGIAPGDHDRVMEPFFTTKPAGNGLGLSVCRSIVWQCQGRILIESPRRDRGLSAEDSGPGTSVSVILPCPAAQHPEVPA